MHLINEVHWINEILWINEWLKRLSNTLPRCVVRNSEGAIVSRQARLRAVIWNEYRVCAFSYLEISTEFELVVFPYFELSTEFGLCLCSCFEVVSLCLFYVYVLVVYSCPSTLDWFIKNFV